MAYRTPKKNKKQVEGQSLVIKHPTGHNFFRWGSRLDPTRITSAIQSADQGYCRELQNMLLEERQKNGALQTVLQARELAISGMEYTVVPAKTVRGKVGRKAAQKAALCAMRIAECDGFDDYIRHLASAPYHGHAVSEFVVNRLTDNPKQSSKKAKQTSKKPRPKDDINKLAKTKYTYKILNHPPNMFRWTQDQVLIYDDGFFATWPTAEGNVLYENPLNFSVHVPRVTGLELPLEGLGKGAIWYAAFRDWAWRNLLVYADEYGKPYRKIKYSQEKAQTEDLSNSIDIAQQLGPNNCVIHSDALEVDMDWFSAANSFSDSPNPLIIELAEKELSMMFLGQKMSLSDVTAGLGGKGDVRDLLRVDLRKADAKSIAERIKEDLLTLICLIEFGDVEDVPTIVFNTGGDEELSTFFNALDVAANKLMLRIPKTWVHEKAKIPMAEMSDEEPVGSSKEKEAQAMAEQASATDAKESNDPEDQEEPTEEPMESEEDESEETEP